MKTILPPPHCNRPPSNFDLATWKSSTFRDWVFHYYMPCCVGIVDAELLEHFSFFAEVFTLLSAQIIHPVQDVERARALIGQFQEQFTTHYSKYSHQIPHYVENTS